MNTIITYDMRGIHQMTDEQKMKLNKELFEGSPSSVNHALTPIEYPIEYKAGMPISISTGVKHDDGKPDMSLLSGIALLKIAQVMSFGKKKYSAHNWRGGFVWSRPLAASLRHIFAYLGGEDKDSETGVSHLAHACCCLFFVLEFEETHKNLDDRYKK